MYALTKNNFITKWPITVDTLREENKDVSFPNQFEDFDYASFGVVFVEETTPPTYDFRTQRIEELIPVNVDEKWKQKWKLVELSDKEKQAALAAAGSAIRSDRNRRLAECDWTQLPDAPVDTVTWASYRQELRDITSQEGFPHIIVWPTKQ